MSNPIWNNPSEPKYISDRELYVRANEELLLPVPSSPITLFPILNKTTGGLRPREFTIVCGATGSGKTTLMANLSHSFVLSETNHFVASVETGPTDFMKRLVCSVAQEDWNHGDPIPPDKLRRFNDQFGDHFRKGVLNLSLYEDRFSVEQLINDIQWMVKNKGVKIAIIDNLNFFLEVTSDSNMVVEMDRVVHALIIFCKQVDVHIIMIMHPKKTESGRVVSEFDIKGSSTAVQEAHNVFLWNRVDQDLIKNGYTKMDRELKIVKMRRRGLAIGQRLIFRSTNGVSYTEGGIVT